LPSPSETIPQTLHVNSRKEIPLWNAPPLRAGPGKTAGSGCRECRKAWNYGKGAPPYILKAPSAHTHAHMVIGLYKVIVPLTPPLKFYFTSNSGLPAERAGFCFALIFFGYFFVSRQKSNWGQGQRP
jgi:hypothetical protein